MRSKSVVFLAMGLLISLLAACSDDKGSSDSDVGPDRGGDATVDVVDERDAAPDLVVPDRGEDGGECPAEPDLTFEGECVGTTVRWCDAGTVNEIDCSPWGTCELITEEFGYWCVGADGGTCPELSPSLCALPGGNGACELGDASAFDCRRDFDSCAAADIDTCTAPQGGGDDDFYVLDCDEFQGEPFVADCGTLGGECVAGTGCTGVDEGNACIPDLVECDNGLDCVIANPDEDFVGSCVGGGGDVGGDMGGDVSGDLGGDVSGDVSTD